MKIISKIEKQYKIVEQIKEFDAIIMKLEKMSMQIEQGQKTNINISVLTSQKQEVEEEENEAPDNPMEYFHYKIRHIICSRTIQSNVETIQLSISDIFTYEIFEIVYKRAVEEREKLIKKLK